MPADHLHQSHTRNTEGIHTMNNYKTEIRERFSRLADGETELTDECPACRGGANKDRAFAVTREGNALLFICYRNSCGLKGRATVSAQALGRKSLPARTRSPERGFAETSLTPCEKHKERAVFDALKEKYHMDESHLKQLGAEVVYLSPPGNLVRPVLSKPIYIKMPLYDLDFQNLGYQLRLFSPTTYQESSPDEATGTHPLPKVCKAFTLLDQAAKEQGKNSYCYFKGTKNKGMNSVVLVEDMYSAVKISRYLPAIALLGTHISESFAKEIGKVFDTVYIALDRDAFVKAVKYCIHYRSKGIWHTSIPIGLDKDIKDLPEAAIRDLLYPLSSTNTHSSKRIGYPHK